MSYLLSGTLKSVLALSAFLDIPLMRHVRMVSLTLDPKNDIFPSVSFSNCCWNTSSRVPSSTIWNNIRSTNTNDPKRGHLRLESSVFVLGKKLIRRFISRYLGIRVLKYALDTEQTDVFGRNNTHRHSLGFVQRKHSAFHTSIIRVVEISQHFAILLPGVYLQQFASRGQPTAAFFDEAEK